MATTPTNNTTQMRLSAAAIAALEELRAERTHSDAVAIEIGNLHWLESAADAVAANADWLDPKLVTYDEAARRVRLDNDPELTFSVTMDGGPNGLSPQLELPMNRCADCGEPLWESQYVSIRSLADLGAALESRETQSSASPSYCDSCEVERTQEIRDGWQFDLDPSRAALPDGWVWLPEMMDMIHIASARRIVIAPRTYGALVTVIWDDEMQASYNCEADVDAIRTWMLQNRRTA